MEARAQLRVGSEASALVGNTPMVELRRLGENLGAELCAKLEYLNPGGSVKDRIGVSMIDAAEAEGRIERGRSVIVEPTSGNTGIALAMVCASRGYHCVLTLPEGMTRERSALLRMYGAVVRETPSMGGMNEAVELAQRDRRGDRQRLHAAAVRQPRQPRGPSPHDRRGDLARPRRRGRRARLRRRDRRDDHGRRAGAQGAPARGPRDGRRARRVRRSLGGPPGPAQAPGDRRRVRARGARPRRDR